MVYCNDEDIAQKNQLQHHQPNLKKQMRNRILTQNLRFQLKWSLYVRCAAVGAKRAELEFTNETWKSPRCRLKSFQSMNQRLEEISLYIQETIWRLHIRFESFYPFLSPLDLDYSQYK